MRTLPRLLLTASALGVGALALHGPNVRQVVAQVTATLVRDLDHPARAAYARSGISSFSPGAYLAGIFLEPVPSGKRLVIEYASVTAVIPAGQTARTDLATNVEGTVTFHALPMFSQGSFAGFSLGKARVSVAGLHLPVYADSGTDVGFTVYRSSNSGSGTATASISGYLVDCGPGPGCALP